MTLLILSMAFIAMLVIANILSVKIVSLGSWVVDVGIIAYPITFLLSDTISEVFGKNTAKNVIRSAFLINLFVIFLVFIAVKIQPADIWSGQAAFQEILGAAPRIMIASMIAYLVSQHHDIYVFHFWKKMTKGKHLWFRNNASTIVSQGIDSIIFVLIAFWGIYENNVLLSMIMTNFILKVIFAISDTPLIYLLVGLIRKTEKKVL